MGLAYAANQQLPAADMNSIGSVAGLYAADSGSSTAYAIAVSPIPTSYAAGDEYSLKAANANTTTNPTLNVNTLGAKTIVRTDGTGLAIGDIVVGGLYRLKYDGTNFQLLNPSPTTPFIIVDTRAANAASGTVSYAHGKGKAPKFAIVHGLFGLTPNSPLLSTCDGSSDGSSNKCMYQGFSNGGGSGVIGTDTSNCIQLLSDTIGLSQAATITFDATNVNVVWVRTGGSGSGTDAISISVFF